MADSFVTIDISAASDTKELVSKLGPARTVSFTQRTARQLADFYYKQFKKYPPYRYVKRKQAYPNAVVILKNGTQVIGWHSERQYRYVMAHIRKGDITPGVEHRSRLMEYGWVMSEPQPGTVQISNGVPYSGYLKGSPPIGRANHMQMIGWKSMDEDSAKIDDRVYQEAFDIVKKELKNLGLQVT
jgi:hypothetical protein